MKLRNIYIKLIALSGCSAILLWLSWPPLSYAPFVFIGFVPLFILVKLSNSYKLTNSLYVLFVYLALFGWNILTTFWIYNTSLTGGLLVHLLNPLIFTIPWLLYFLAKKHFNSFGSITLFISSWISLEYLHHTWQLSFPLLTLGNSMGMYPELIQFYEYTGVYGGTLWVILVNYSVFRVIDVSMNKNRGILFKKALFAIIILGLPAAVSLWLFKTYDEKGKEVNVLAVHTNIDCRQEKYKVKAEELTDRYIKQTLTKLDRNTDFILWPETALTDLGWLKHMSGSLHLKKIRDSLFRKNRNLNLITGAIVYGKSREGIESPSVRYSDKSDIWYRTYNAALLANSNSISIRSKEKLVPVEEDMSSGILTFFSKLVPSLGGFSFSTLSQNTHVMKSSKGVKVTPLICYESLFGNLSSEYVREGAEVFFVILNEGWYKDINGASQFMYASVIRAIESRRSIARSSNDGISCFINQKGEILKKTSSYNSKVLESNLRANRSLTFYAVFGDYLPLGSAFLSIIGIFILLFTFFKKSN